MTNPIVPAANAIPRRQHIPLGVLYGVISAFSFALMSVLVKKTANHFPTSMLIFFRFFISLALLLPWIFYNRHFTLKIQEPVRYAIRIFSALSALCCVFYAIKFIPLVDALLLNNTAPLFVPLIALCLTGAKIPKKAYMGIILGFIGVAVILQPGHEIFSGASLIALGSGILAALAIVQMRLLSKTSTTHQMLFYYFFISTLVSGVAALLQWQSPTTLNQWLLLGGIGILGTLYQVFATLSYTTAPVRLMSPLVFMTVIFGGIFDWLVWGNMPNLLTILGALLIIIGAVITVYFGQKEMAPR